MKIRTKEDLLDKIYEEISWRKKELKWIREISLTDGKEQDYALRAGIPIAYAHFEGSIKNIAEYYLIYVSNKKIKYKNLTDNFIALGLRSKIIDIQKTKKNSLHTSFITTVFNIKDEESRLPTSNIIDTESNIKSDVFLEICFTIGIDVKKYETRFSFIDEVILNLRNRIAHGERIRDISLDKRRFIDICDTVTWLIDQFSDDVLEAALNDKFYRVT